MNKEFWKGRNVLVTGCTGLLGYWMTKTLVDAGANVTGIVRDIIPGAPFFKTGLDKRINIVYGTIEDYRLVERAINEHEIECVFHLAAQAIVTTANRSSISTLETNIKGTWNVLEACRLVSTVKRIVVASSDKAYGSHPTLPYTEDFPLQGRHPYDVSKTCTDLICQMYASTYQLPVAITRCGNLYGGGDLQFSRIIPDVMRSIMQNKAPVIRSDGLFSRDYLYVSDAVNGYLMLAEQIEKPEVRGKGFNFGTENPVTVLDLTKRIIAVSGKQNISPVVLGTAKYEIKDQFLSSKKARDVLGWKPLVNLDQGLKETWQWYADFFGGTNH